MVFQNINKWLLMGKDNMVSESARKPYVIYPNKLSDRGAFDIVIFIFNHNVWNLADCINKDLMVTNCYDRQTYWSHGIITFPICKRVGIANVVYESPSMARDQLRSALLKTTRKALVVHILDVPIFHRILHNIDLEHSPLEVFGNSQSWHYWHFHIS